MSDCSTHAFDVPLKSCPFCGGEARTAVKSYGDTHYWRIYCDTIDCAFGASGVFRTEAEAIAAWNSRAEQTCRFIDDSDGEFPPKCSACGYEPSIYECSWLGDGGYEFEGNYCPNCGVRVIGTEAGE